MSSDLVTYLTEQLDPAGCKVINLPDRIWVLGGFMTSPGEPPASLRDCFWRRTIESTLNRSWVRHLACPEEFPEWWAFSGYEDLLTFERDACFLARAILLFVESPGAIAELGCLASHESILPNILTVVQRHHLERDRRNSFLNLGPLKRVREHGGECVIGTNQEKELPEVDFDTIIETIENIISTNQMSSSFDKNNQSHVLLLVADVIDLMLVSKEKEIDYILNFYNVKLDEKILKQYLELLNFFDLVKKEKQGREIFWVRAPSSAAPWVDHKAKSGQKFVRERFKVGAEEYVKRNNLLRSVYGRIR